MASYNCLLYVFIISVSQVINNTLALNKETIVGGTLANRGVFTYQAAIIGRQNYSRNFQLLCGAAIIDDKFVLTTAGCFFNNAGKLKKLSFVVFLDDLMLEEGIKIDVDIVYMFGLKSASSLSDIAVVKLKKSLPLRRNPKLKKLELPTSPKLRRSIFLVSGYGASKVKTVIDPISKIEKQTLHRADWILRFGIVKIVNNEKCKDLLPSFVSDEQLCGIIIPRNLSAPEGLCKADYGNPLVSGRTIVGLASKSPANCDNRFSGSLYTKVSEYVKFIQAVLQGNLSDIASVLHAFKNPPYILERLLY